MYGLLMRGRDRQWQLECVRGSDVGVHAGSLDKQDAHRACLAPVANGKLCPYATALFVVRNCEIVFTNAVWALRMFANCTGIARIGISMLSNLRKSSA